MDKSAAEREAIRLWRNLPLQERLSPQQAIAFAAMVAPTLDFDEPHKRSKQIEGWLLKDLPRTQRAVAMGPGAQSGAQLVLPAPSWPQREGASAIAFVIALLLMIARRADILTNAMFWAEDGAVFFADAYNHGWTSLIQPYAGYFQLFPRLIFDIATLLPVRWAPLFGVWVALLVRAALPAFIFSSRLAGIDWRAKVALTAYYLLMPNLAEVHANIVNTQLYLGLYLLAVILADAPRTVAWKIHDWAVLVIAGLSGPFVIFVLPVLGFRLHAQRDMPSARLPFMGLAVAIAVVQMACIGVTAGLASPLGADPLAMLSILGTRVYLGFITPVRWAATLSGSAAGLVLFAIGAAISVAVFVRGDWRAKGLVLIAPLMIAASFYSPVFALSQPQWPGYFDGNPAERFFVVSAVAWAGTVFYFAAIYLRRLSALTLAAGIAVCGFFILLEFTIAAVPGAQFVEQAAMIERAEPGSAVTVPIAPPGWVMTLIKH